MWNSLEELLENSQRMNWRVEIWDTPKVNEEFFYFFFPAISGTFKFLQLHNVNKTFLF